MARKKVTTQKTVEYTDQIKNTIKTANNFVLETTEEILDEAIAKGAAWQNISAKAIEGGLKLAKNQQDVIFTALETIKSSFVKGRKRFETSTEEN